LALMHKGLDFDTVPVAFTEKDKIAFSGQDKVPVIDDDGTVVCDSWAIAEYLEDTYPDKPPLFPGERGRAYAKMTNDWTDKLNPLILKSIIVDVYDRLDAVDQRYFRKTRELRFGKPLEDVQAGREETREQLREGMASMRAHLMDGPFVGGEVPSYSDFIVYGSLRWAQLCSEFAMLEEDDPVQQWYRRVAEALNID